MSAVVGELVWKVTGDTSGIDKSLKQTDQKAQGLAGNFKSAMGVMAGAIIGAGIAKKIFDIGKASLKAAANMETQTVAFTTMLGSADKAQSLIRQVSEFAASTPFQLPEVVDASKKLIAFGESSETVVGTIRRLGDVASGLSIPLGELTEIYGKARVQGTLYAEDLNQLAGRGIPIFTELAKVMGVNSSEIKKLGSEGKISFNELEQVFKNLTSEGGQFAGLMDAQSRTLSGKWSNFNDALERTAVIIGQEMSPATGDLISLMTNLVNKFNSLASASSNDAGAKSLGIFARTIKNANADLDGTWDSLNKIFDLMGEQVDDSLANEIKAWEASSTGVTNKIDDLSEKYGEVNAAAGIYSQYLSGQVKLTDAQVEDLKKIINSWAKIQNTAATAEKEQLEAIKNENKERGKGKELTDKEKKWLSERKRIEKEITDFINQNTKSETELLKMELDERKSALLKYSKDRKQTAKWIADIEKIYADKIADSEEKSFQERLNKTNDFVQQVGGAFNNLLSSFQALNSAMGAQAIAALDARMEAELEAAGLAEETAVEKAEAELKAAEESGDAQTINEKKKALEKAKIEEKYAKKRAQLEYEMALRGWELQVAIATATVPMAILNAYTGAQAATILNPTLSGWYPPLMAGLAAVASGAQLAAVIASQPAPPQFEQGGIVPGSSFTGDNVLARVNSGEMILNQQQQSQLFNMANGGGGGYRQIPPMSADSLWKLIFEASQSGDLFIAERAVTSR